jgi:hypothetical protein
VYALTPVSKHTLEQANANNIQLKDLSMTKNMTIPAMDVNSPVKQAPKPLAVVTSAVN